MALLTGANMISLARKLVQDTSATNPGLADADYLDAINEQYHLWQAVFGDRNQYLSGTTLWGATVPFDDGSATGGYKQTTLVTLDDVLALYALQTYNVAGIYAEMGLSAGGTPMERVELSRIQSLYVESNVKGTPRRYALERPQTTTAGDIGKWIVWIQPVPTTGTYWSIYALARKFPTDLTTGTTPDVSEEACRYITRLASVQAALMLGRDADWREAILQPIPNETRSALRKQFKRQADRPPVDAAA